jgi:hypothetical protein
MLWARAAGISTQMALAAARQVRVRVLDMTL